MVGGFFSLKPHQMDMEEQALQRLAIGHLRYRRYAPISSGERQLALIAWALVQQAKILLMDEPIANLDYGNQLKIMAQIKELTCQGYAAVVSTHNPNHALWFADEIFALSAGKVLAFGLADQVLTSQLRHRLHGANVHIVDADEEKIRIYVPQLDVKEEDRYGKQ